MICGLASASPGRAEEHTTSLPAGMCGVPSGVYRPLFRGTNDPKEVSVKAFFLDARPVTNAEFMEFVRVNPRWQRSQVKRLFAVLGMATRISGDFWPQLLVSHYSYGALLWIAGVLLWSIFVLPKVLVANTED